MKKIPIIPPCSFLFKRYPINPKITKNSKIKNGMKIEKLSLKTANWWFGGKE